MERSVLFALCGMSPAVITETVWALAHASPRELPDRVVVLTTRKGRDAIRRDLLDSGVWAALRAALKVGAGRLAWGDAACAATGRPQALHWVAASATAVPQ